MCGIIGPHGMGKMEDFIDVGVLFLIFLCVRKIFVKERYVHVGKLSKSKYSRKRPVETSHQEFLNFQHKAIK